MAIKQSELENLLKEAFPNSEIEISDLAGDDNHFAAKICSSLFKKVKIKYNNTKWFIKL